MNEDYRQLTRLAEKLGVEADWFEVNAAINKLQERSGLLDDTTC